MGAVKIPRRWLSDRETERQTELVSDWASDFPTDISCISHAPTTYNVALISAGVRVCCSVCASVVCRIMQFVAATAASVEGN